MKIHSGEIACDSRHLDRIVFEARNHVMRTVIINNREQNFTTFFLRDNINFQGNY